MMMTFDIHDMTCGHCVSRIGKAVHEMDPTAQIRADLQAHRVQIESTHLDRTKLGELIRAAGYTPIPVDDGAVSTERPVPRSGCCCR